MIVRENLANGIDLVTKGVKRVRPYVRAGHGVKGYTAQQEPGKGDLPWERAYRAWRSAAERGYGEKRSHTPGEMEQIDARIRRLKGNYERLLREHKGRAVQAQASYGAHDPIHRLDPSDPILHVGPEPYWAERDDYTSHKEEGGGLHIPPEALSHLPPAAFNQPRPPSPSGFDAALSHLPPPEFNRPRRAPKGSPPMPTKLPAGIPSDDPKYREKGLGGYASVASHVRGGHAVRGYRQRRSAPTSYMGALSYLGKRSSRGGPRGKNARVYRDVIAEEGGQHPVHYRLHHTNIATFHPDDTMTLRTGGWHSVTTKMHLNAMLRGRGSLYSERGDWMYAPQRSTQVPGFAGHEVPFAEGMKIGPSGEVLHQGSNKSVVIKSVETTEGTWALLAHIQRHGVDEVAEMLTDDEAAQLVAKSATAAQREKTHTVMHEFKHGKLRSGTGKPGEHQKAPVKKRKQAIAIALSEAGLSKKALW